MSEFTSTTTTEDLLTGAVSVDVIRQAIADGIAVAEPIHIGDHGQLVITPPDYTATILDERVQEDYPRERHGDFPFVSVASLSAYVGRYLSSQTVGYISDVNGRGHSALIEDLKLATYVIDDFPTDGTANRVHRARLVLRPTTQARRWGKALSGALNQEQMLDLVVDGIGEIVDPDGAELRDLISDLHAIRTTDVKSVIRTGGEASIQVGDNVKLHAGTGNTVTVPEQIVVTFHPYAGILDAIMLDIRVKPVVRDDHVHFVLTAPGLDQALTDLVSNVADELATHTGVELLWIP